MTNNEAELIKTVGGHRVLYVMATQAEYQRELQSRFTPLICGVGPVEAAVNVARFLEAHKDIDFVVSLGSAGSAKLEQTQVYQVRSVSYRDMDASPLGFEKGVTPFLALPAELDLPFDIPGIPSATLSTGGNIISGEAYHAIAADMVDMETWAILRACQNAGVAMAGLRGISDGAKPLAEYSDWTEFLEIIDGRLAGVVDLLEDALMNDRLAKKL